MKVIGCRVKVISRGKGSSVVGASAYRAGEKIKNEWDDMTYDYTHKQGIHYSEILLPENAPERLANRSTLWNEIEQVEKRKDARLAREIQIDLPLELTRKQSIELAKEYAKRFLDMGMIADISIHAPDKGTPNPHAHLLLTDRPLNGQEFADKKNTDWNKREHVEIWRQQYAELCNQYLERYQQTDRVDHRSYERQGIDQVATIRLSRIDYEREQQGIRTQKGDINRAIRAENQQREQLQELLRQTDRAIEQAERELAKEQSRITQEADQQRQRTEATQRQRERQAEKEHARQEREARERQYRKPTLSDREPSQYRPPQPTEQAKPHHERPLTEYERLFAEATERVQRRREQERERDPDRDRDR